MIIIYPEDITTKYLNLFVTDDSIKNLTRFIYSDFSNEKINTTIELIKKSDPAIAILFLGHGSDEDLKLAINSSISSESAISIFKNKKLILLSCYSAEFLDTLSSQFEVAIGFGNILDSQVDLSYKDYIKYNYENYQCIYEFRSRLLDLLKICIIEAHEYNYTFLQLFYALKLRINKIISLCSLSKNKTDRLIGELMYDLKKNMVVKGNSKSFLSN